MKKHLRLLAILGIWVLTLTAARAAAPAENLPFQIRELDAELVMTRTGVIALQEALVAAVARNDAFGMRAVQWEIRAQQARAAAADNERALLLKRLEEAGREADALRRRGASQNLGKNLEIRVLLANAAETAARGKRVEAARKELDYQQAQIRKYLSRAENAARKGDELRVRLRETEAADLDSDHLPTSDPLGGEYVLGRLIMAKRDVVGQIRRNLAAETAWFRLNQDLAARARRNLAWADADLRVQEAYVAALSAKEFAQAATTLQTMSVSRDAEYTTARNAVEVRQQELARDLAAAEQEITKALADLGRSPLSLEMVPVLKARWETGLARKSRLEAAAELLKEIVSLHKTRAAFAQEKADRAADLAKSKPLIELEGDLHTLRESLVASAQYIAGFTAVLQKQDGVITGLQGELRRDGVDAGKMEALARMSECDWSGGPDNILEWTNPLPPTTVAELISRLDQDAAMVNPEPPVTAEIARLSAARRLELARELLLRGTMRAFIHARLEISKGWQGHSIMIANELEQRLTNQLWTQQDRRFDVGTMNLFGIAFAAAWADAWFLPDEYRLGTAADRGWAPCGRLLFASAGLVLLTLACGFAAGRLRRRHNRTAELLARLTVRVLPGLAWAGALRFLLPGNHAAELLAAVAAAWALWELGRALLPAGGCPDRRFPGPATFAGSLFAAMNRLLAVTAAAAALGWFVGRGGEGAADLRLLIQQAWYFLAWLILCRLLLHPSLLGRFLSRQSQNRVVRALGGGAAWACLLVAALAVMPYLLSLHNLGIQVLRVSVSSFLLLGLGLAVNAVAARVLRRPKTETGNLKLETGRGGQSELAEGDGNGAELSSSKFPVSSFQSQFPNPEPRTLNPEPAPSVFSLGLLQTAVSLAVTAAVDWLWWRLLAGILLSPAAPAGVQEFVALLRKVWHGCGQVWVFPVGSGMTVGSMAEGLAVFALAFPVSRVVRALFLERVLTRTPMDEPTRQTFVTILGYVVILTGFLFGLNVAGSSPKNLALLAGAITVGLGFGLQNIINNFVSSLLIHFGQTVRVGDYIDVGGTKGTVREIGLRQTRIVTDDGVTILVPNGTFISANIINWTNPGRATRLHLPLTLGRQVDLALAAQLLTETAAANARIVRQPAPTLEVRTVAADKISVELLAWTEQPEQQAAILGELTLELDRVVRDRNLG